MPLLHALYFLYIDAVKDYKEGFEKSEFYLLLKEGTRKSLSEALQLLHDEKINLKLKSFQPETSGTVP